MRLAEANSTRVFWDTPTLQVAERALDRTSLRQRVLAHNLANVNTPGYQRRDVPFENHLKAAQKNLRVSGGSSTALPMRTTDPRHFTESNSFFRVSSPEITLSSGPMRMDGNSIDPDMEMAALAENELRYAVLTRIAGGQIRGLMTAITGGKNP
jgi:flagellar basal-body rod protein FlgB